MRRYVWNVLVNGIAAGAWFPGLLRPATMRLLGARVGRASIRRRVDFYGPDIEIGDSTFINVGTQIQNYATVTIGRDVRIGPRVTILTVDHEIGPSEARAAGLIAKPVEIEDGAWLAAAVTVLPGVTIGQGCIIAAGAVVREDCKPDHLYAGVPAKMIRPVDR